MSFWPVRLSARHRKPQKASRRFTAGGGVFYEVREWGTYPDSGIKRWTTWMVTASGEASPMTAPSLVRPSFDRAERALVAFAKRGVLMEVER